MKTGKEPRKHHTAKRSKAPFFSENGRVQARPFFQAKLQIGAPGDRFERQADAVADRVVSQGTASDVQRMCDGCADDARREGELRRQPLKKEEEPVQAKADPELRRQALEEEETVRAQSESGRADSAGAGLRSRLGAAEGGGARLPSPVLEEMSTSFGRDFGGVRVHTGSPAEQLSQDLGAQAFTHGRNVYFNRGKFAPESVQGKRLLAHELTHVVQQGYAGPSAAMSGPRVQRDLIPRNADCGQTTSLPISETESVRRGAHFTETFPRPPSGRIRVTVSATAEDSDCHPENTFGVNVCQCHIVTDESLEPQHVKRFGETISYEIDLPGVAWNTYDKFYLRLYATCGAELTVSVTAVTNP